MADHFRIPFIVGNTLFRDHALWPTVTRSKLIEYRGGDPMAPTDGEQRGIDVDYPAEVTLRQLMMLYRVKTWTMEATTVSGSCGAYRAPVVGQDDVAQINFIASWPSWDFQLQRKAGHAPFLPRDIVNEQEIAADWDNSPQATDFTPNPSHIALWKTNRNEGNFTSVFDNPDGNPITDDIVVNYSFTEPYSHDKFGESGVASGDNSSSSLFMLYDLVLYDPTTKLFKPKMFFRNGINVNGGPGRNPLPFTQDIRLIPDVPAVTPVLQPPDPDVIGGTLRINFGSTGVDPIVIKLAYSTFIHRPPIAPGIVVPPNTFATNFILNATEFWQYRNGLGQLVDDDTDGSNIAPYFA